MNQIQRSLTATAVFVLVGGGALMLATWDKRTRVAADERKEKEKKVFPDLKAQDATHVELTHEGVTVVADKDGNDWKLSTPLVTLGDDAAWEAVVSAVVNLSAKTRFKDGDLTPGSVGLEQAVTRVSVKTADGKAAQVWVGKKNTFDDSVYVRAGEDAATAPVVTAAGYSVASLQKSLFDLREKRLLTLNSSDANHVELQAAPGGAGASFAAQRVSKDGKAQWDDPWRLSAPVPGAADREEVNKLLQTLTAARAVAFVDETGKDLAAYGLDAPAFTLTVGGGGKTSTVVVGAKTVGAEKKYYMKRADAPSVAEVTETVMTALNKDAFTWRDKRVVDFDRDAVSRMSVTLPDGKTLILSKAAGDAGTERWQVESPEKGPAKGWRASSLLYALQSLKVSRFVMEGGITPDVLVGYGLKEPSRTAQLQDAQGRVLATLLLGKTQGTQVYLMAKGGTFVGEVETSKVDEWPKAVGDYLQASGGDGGPMDADDEG